MTFIDLLNVPNLTDPQLSPDGRHVIYALAKADWKANKRISHIWRINADGTDEIQLTSGTDGESGARWSPDSRTHRVSGEARSRRSGADLSDLQPGGGEARALTTHPTAISNITWSADGASIYFLASDAKTEDEKARDKAKDDVFALDEDYKQRHLWTRHGRGPPDRPSHQRRLLGAELRSVA